MCVSLLQDMFDGGDKFWHARYEAALVLVLETGKLMSMLYKIEQIYGGQIDKCFGLNQPWLLNRSTKQLDPIR